MRASLASHVLKCFHVSLIFMVVHYSIFCRRIREISGSTEFRMKAHKVFVHVLAIVGCLLNLQAAIAHNSVQDSDRDRTRDTWQRPAEVFDALLIKPGHRVADIGCGYGYFSVRLAAQVGAQGKVYAVDIDQKAIDRIRERKEREKLEQLEPVLGESSDPRLPADLDSVLIVDTYHEFRDWDRMMQAVLRALKPGGRLVIIDGDGPAGRPRTEYHRLHTIPSALVREEITRNGFDFKETRPGFYDAEYGKNMYFLVFEKPKSPAEPKRSAPSDTPPCALLNLRF
jgi:predicted methyltransferase